MRTTSSSPSAMAAELLGDRQRLVAALKRLEESHLDNVKRAQGAIDEAAESLLQSEYLKRRRNVEAARLEFEKLENEFALQQSRLFVELQRLPERIREQFNAIRRDILRRLDAVRTANAPNVVPGIGEDRDSFYQRAAEVEGRIYGVRNEKLRKLMDLIGRLDRAWLVDDVGAELRKIARLAAEADAVQTEEI